MPEHDTEALAGRIARCRRCVESPMGTPLPQEPRPVVHLSDTAKVCIVGQAPGLRVHESGIPFDDRSGDRLREWLNVDRETFYDRRRLAIVPMGFCFPGYDKNKSDLPPRKECAEQWRDEVFRHMPQIELLLVIGGYAQDWHLDRKAGESMTATVQNWRYHLHSDPDCLKIPLPHPSWRNTGWLKKNDWFEREVIPVLRDEVHARL